MKFKFSDLIECADNARQEFGTVIPPKNWLIDRYSELVETKRAWTPAKSQQVFAEFRRTVLELIFSR